MADRIAQFNRILRWPREKRARFWARYDQWTLHKLNKYGTGQELTYEERVAQKKGWLTVNRFNRGGE